MNLLLLSDEPKIWRQSFKEIFPKHFFKEVNENGQQRIDCIFGEISSELSPTTGPDIRGGDRMDTIRKLLDTGGVSIVLLEINENILYNRTDEFRQKLFKLFNENVYQIELRSICVQAFGQLSNAYKLFAVIYLKDWHTLVFNDDNGLTYKKSNDTNEYIKPTLNQEICKYLLSKVKNNILEMK